VRTDHAPIRLGLLLLALGVVAQAAPIVVLNASFETLPGSGLNHPNPDGPFSDGPIPSWGESGTGATGQYQPNTNAFSVQDDGPTVAYSNSGTIFQDVTNVVANTTYTLMVDIGNRIDTGDFASADLLVNGVRYAATGTTAAKGLFATFTATYAALPGDVGDPIRIELVSTGGQADFDNVRMDAVSNASPVPEPVPTMLLFVGLGGVMIWKQRFN